MEPFDQRLKTFVVIFFSLVVLALVFTTPVSSYAHHAGGVPVGTVQQAGHFVYFGFTPRVIQASGNYAYVGNLNSYYDSNLGRWVTTRGYLNVFDIAKLLDPRYEHTTVPSVGWAMIAGTHPNDIHIINNFAYVVSSTVSWKAPYTFTLSALEVFDLVDPIKPKLVGSVNTGTEPTSVFVAGQYAYVTAAGSVYAVSAGSGALQIFDISGAAPTLVGSADIGDNSQPSDVYVLGNYAYVAAKSSQDLQVFDISNKQSPVKLNTVSLGFNPWSIDISGQYLYVAGQKTTGGSFKIFDISNPASPVEKGSYVGPVRPSGSSATFGFYKIKVYGGVAYLAVDGSTQSFDISNPSNIVVQAASTGSGARSIDVADGRVFVVNVGLAHSWPTLPYTTTGHVMISTIQASRALAAAPTMAPPTDEESEVLEVCPATAGTDPVVLSTTKTGSPIQRTAAAGTLQVVGKYAYVADAWGVKELQIYDVSNPDAPVKVSSLKTGGHTFGVAIAGKYAYLTDIEAHKLVVADISNPASPKILNSVDAGIDPRSIYISGKYAYVGDLWSPDTAILVFDLSNPANPVKIGSAPSNGPWSIHGSGKYIYVASYYSNMLQVFDISNPAAPTLVGSADTPGQPISVYVAGNYAYVLNFSPHNLQIFDISDPKNPQLMATALDVGFYPRSVMVIGHYAYLVGTSSDKFQIYNVADPKKPVEVTSVQTDVYPSFIRVSGKYAYILNSSSFQIFDISGTTCLSGPEPEDANAALEFAPTLASATNTDNSPIYIYIYRGHECYVVNRITGSVQIFDVTNPQKPILLGEFQTDPGCEGIYVLNNYAYVVNGGSNTLQIFDVSNLQSPRLVGSIGTGNFPQSVHVVGNYVYVTNRDSHSLQVFDVSNPASPQLVNSAGLRDCTCGTYVINKYIYITSEGTNSLQVFDISNPASPRLVGTVATSPHPSNVHVSGNYAYVTSYYNNTLQIFDVSNPARPRAMGIAHTAAGPHSVYVPASYVKTATGSQTVVSGSYAYVATLDTNKLQVFDVSNPLRPVIVVVIDAGPCGCGLWVDGNYVYMVNTEGNILQIFDISRIVSRPPAMTAGFEPVLISTTQTGPSPQDLYVSGSNVFVSDVASYTIQTFNVSNPAKPVNFGFARTSSDPRSVFGFSVAGCEKCLCVTNWITNIIEIFDVSNPAKPVRIGSVKTSTGPWDVYVDSPYIYVTNYVANTLQIFDASNPSSPRLTGQIATNALPFSVDVSGNYAYVTSAGSGKAGDSGKLQIFDISNPSEPVLAGSVETNSGPRSVDVEGNLAYVTNWDSNTLQIFDVSSPANVRLVGSVNTDSNPRSVDVADNYAYVANTGSDTLQVFDVSNPAKPQLFTTLTTGTDPRAVQVSGQNVYVINSGSDSLQVFDLYGGIGVSEPSAPTLPVVPLTPMAPVIQPAAPVPSLLTTPLTPAVPSIIQQLTPEIPELPSIPAAEETVPSITPTPPTYVPPVIQQLTPLVPEIPSVLMPVTPSPVSPPAELPSAPAPEIPTTPAPEIPTPPTSPQPSALTPSDSVLAPQLPVAPEVPEAPVSEEILRPIPPICVLPIIQQIIPTIPGELITVLPVPETILTPECVLGPVPIPTSIPTPTPTPVPTPTPEEPEEITPPAEEITPPAEEAVPPVEEEITPPVILPVPEPILSTDPLSDDGLSAGQVDKLKEGRRMTGGGDVANVSHGFTLHCDKNELPNNLEINWGTKKGTKEESHKFHLENLTSAVCSDNPAISEEMPVAGFDTFVGAGIGRYDGISGATVEFIFSDAGEPGKNDFAEILIKDKDGKTVLDISGALTFGNQQAHP